MSGQDESNPVLWLATWVGKMELQMYLALWLAFWAGKMELSCLLGTTCRVPHIINPLLTKLAWSRWLDIGLVLFFVSLWTSTPSRSKTCKKRICPISSHLAWHLVNNPYSTYTILIAVRFELQNVSIANTCTCTLILYILVKKIGKCSHGLKEKGKPDASLQLNVNPQIPSVVIEFCFNPCININNIESIRYFQNICD